MASTNTTNRTMSDTHKAALAEGRAQGRAVRHYLEALESSKPKRGRKRTRESVAKRLEAVEALLETADPVKRLQLSQERLDLEAELAADEETVDLAGIEAEFLAAAKPYSERKGISYAAWREIGVPASTLRAAGITRSSR
jgi:serine phosphatase RsbU (regulator of sigma subunit)